MKTEKKRISKQMHFVSKRTGTAISDYDMLKDGDNIMVAVSGSKRSMSLLKLLKYRQSFVPIKIDIMAVHIDFGASQFFLKEIEDHFKSMDVRYRIEKVSFPRANEPNDAGCRIYSKERQDILFFLARKLGFNKIALGQGMDDIAESILFDLFFEGKEAAICPKQVFFDGEFAIIRPLAYVTKKDIEVFAVKERIPGFTKYENISNGGAPKRKAMRKLLSELDGHNPYIKRNIVRSMHNIKQDYLL